MVAPVSWGGQPGEKHFVVEEASAECIFDVISVSCGCRPTRHDVQ